VSNTIRLWLTVPVAARMIGVPKDGLYRDIRSGTCPFRTVVVSGRIHVSARDIGLFEDGQQQQEQRIVEAEPIAA